MTHHIINLCLSQHCDFSLKRPAAVNTYKLFRAPKSNRSETYIRAYRTYNRPIIELGIKVINPTEKNDIELLKRVQIASLENL